MTLNAPSTQATSLLSATKTIRVAMPAHSSVLPKDHTIEIDAHPCNLVGQNTSSQTTSVGARVQWTIPAFTFEFSSYCSDSDSTCGSIVYTIENGDTNYLTINSTTRQLTLYPQSQTDIQSNTSHRIKACSTHHAANCVFSDTFTITITLACAETSYTATHSSVQSQYKYEINNSNSI